MLGLLLLCHYIWDRQNRHLGGGHILGPPERSCPTELWLAARVPYSDYDYHVLKKESFHDGPNGASVHGTSRASAMTDRLVCQWTNVIMHKEFWPKGP